MIGNGALADRKDGIAGYDPEMGQTSSDQSEAWKATASGIAIGGGKLYSGELITRQLTGLAAGSEDTDAVNVAQLKKAVAGIRKPSETNDTRNTVTGGTNVTVDEKRIPTEVPVTPCPSYRTAK